MKREAITKTKTKITGLLLSLAAVILLGLSGGGGGDDGQDNAVLKVVLTIVGVLGWSFVDIVMGE